MYNLITSNDCQFYFLLAAGVVAFYLFAYPYIVKHGLGGSEHFDQGTLAGTDKIDKSMCSKDCCSPQWPVGFDTDRDPRVQPGDVGTKYMPTSYTCSGTNAGDKGVGCPCVTKKQYDMLGSRGENNIF
ncbi:MAG: hypothetical protein Faunusvirus8_7 [Faunusvirus sp.]|jgi:hypothetical protein|uniref:Uncharacterized protein n=1 Tax=Faunusvirus sp. TaxID=2487766 RepID=A0A3G4ZWS1_9VIRU|nr:MAG: hypothetical protein Faunusvirus8_7 [Faunusvirus sp.]